MVFCKKKNHHWRITEAKPPHEVKWRVFIIKIIIIGRVGGRVDWGNIAFLLIWPRGTVSGKYIFNSKNIDGMIWWFARHRLAYKVALIKYQLFRTCSATLLPLLQMASETVEKALENSYETEMLKAELNQFHSYERLLLFFLSDSCRRLPEWEVNHGAPGSSWHLSNAAVRQPLTSHLGGEIPLFTAGNSAL